MIIINRRNVNDFVVETSAPHQNYCSDSNQILHSHKQERFQEGGRGPVHKFEFLNSNSEGCHFENR